MTQEAIVLKILEIYCKWLNMWTESEGFGPPNDKPHHYTTEQFLRWDSDEGFYGSTRVEYVLPLWHQVYVLSVSDGDDGGPATLYAWVALDAYSSTEPFRVVHLVQEFDTYVQEIYDHNSESKFLHTPQAS